MSEDTPTPPPPSIPITKPSFNWESPNLHDTFKTFKHQVTFLLDKGPYGKCQEPDKIAAFLNWLGPKSYEIYEGLELTDGKSKGVYKDVVEAFESYFKPTQSQFQCWYQLGALYSGAFKTQSEFMMRLKDVAEGCEFSKKEEHIKFLFLTHNQNSRVRDALIEKMKPGDSLNDSCDCKDSRKSYGHRQAE